MNDKVYLDHAATTPLCKSFLESIQRYAELYYNPSSANEYSIALKYDIEDCREKVAKLINCEPEEVYFTSSSTEACAIAIDGFLKANYNYLVAASNIEHAAIMDNPNIDLFIECNKDGFIDPTKWQEMNFTCKALYAFMLANNEIGTIQPIKQISEYIHRNNGILFSDLTAAIGKMPIDVKDMGIDIACFGGHKIGALKGVGVLYIKKNVKIKGISYGHQENCISPGTYNYLAIKSLDMAIDEVNLDKQKDVLELRNYLMNRLIELNCGVKFNGDLENRVAGNLNIYIPITIDNQQLVSLLDMEGYIVSSGSACSNGTNKPSHVLKAIGLSGEEINHSIRITLSEQNTKEEIDGFVEALKNIIDMYKMEGA